MASLKRKTLKSKYLFSIAVLIIGIIILSIVSHSSYKNERENKYATANLNASVYASRMSGGMDRGVAITTALKEIIVDGDGNINNFYKAAKNLIMDYIQCIQIAPNGVITKIYPEEGNEAGKIDLFADSVSGEICRYGKEQKVVTMQGPFDLKQGGKSIAVRNPVYLENESGESVFWGFTIVVIRIPEIFMNSVQALSDFGYEYCLSKKFYTVVDGYEIDTSYQKVYSSGGELSDSVEYEFDMGNCAWKLQVMPTNGWVDKTRIGVTYGSGLVIVLLAGGIALMFMSQVEHKKAFAKQAVTDPLTNLYNRNGFDNEVKRYLAENPHTPCVAIALDIDDFKFVNDLYGHAAGDVALQTLADNMRSVFSENAILSRNGGDEFCAFLENCTARQAEEKIKRFMQMSHAFRIADGEKHTFGISLGCAEYPVHAHNYSDLFAKADMALYEVKLYGKNNYRTYNSNLHTEKRAKLGFALNDVSKNLPGAFLIYKADEKDDRILFANNELIKFTGCTGFDDFIRFTGGSFRNLIRPDERKEVEASIWKQINSATDGSNDYVQYHLAVKDGTFKPILDHGRIVENDYYGRVFYVLIMDSRFIKTHYEED